MTTEAKFLPNYKECCVSVRSTIVEGLTAIAKSGALLAAAIDAEGVLVGIFTDSDARRAILGGALLTDSIEPFLKRNPIVGSEKAEAHELRQMAQVEGVREIPLVDDKGRLADVFIVVAHEERLASGTAPMESREIRKLPNPMFLIAGGKGTRLKSVVSDRPKPLALVGGRPIIQTIIENAKASGVTKFFVALNYKAEMIEAHLESDCYAGLDIECIREAEFLGTAGSLGYLQSKWSEPIIVSNADVLTNVSIERVVEFHYATKAAVTCVVRPYHFQVPFGVVEIGPKGVTGIREKPLHKHIVNAGIYVLSPEVKKFISQGQKIDMPNLLEKVIEAGYKVAPFLMHEYWRDVGRPEEYALANQEYGSIFGQ